MYRWHGGAAEVFLVHPGGPFWVKRDLGAWSIPKGAHEPGETPLDSARREFTEETGFVAAGPFVDLGSVLYRRGKTVAAWAVKGDCDPEALRSITCFVEWPPRSGRSIEVPEVDRGAWFSLDEARRRILPAQEPFLDRLTALLAP